jgi:hypothetical protein
MNRLWMMTLCAVLVAGSAASQAHFGKGDLAPRDGTMLYMTSDRPEALAALFGKDEDGNWKLRNMIEKQLTGELESMIEEDEQPDEVTETMLEQLEEMRGMINWAFEAYDSIASMEMVFTDVTLEGPKVLMMLHLKQGRSVEITPEFMAEMVLRTETYSGVRYVEYGEAPPEEDEWGMHGGMGLPSIYVAEHPQVLLLSNFETTLQEAIRTLVGGDFEESLSSRPEFNEWRNNRQRHDLSAFYVMREVQNTIERLLPPQDQAPELHDAYRKLDEWMQLREYTYVAYDIDLNEAERSITMSSEARTRRPTRMLTEFSVPAGPFQLLRYVPSDAYMVAGTQLKDANEMLESYKKLTRDFESLFEMLLGGMLGGGMEPWPGEEWPDEDRMDSVNPGGLPGTLEDQAPSQIDEALAMIDEVLEAHGTSLAELLSQLGTEAVMFMEANPEAAKENAWGTPDMGDLIENSYFGFVLAIKDRARLLSIIERAIELAGEEHPEVADITRGEIHGASLYLHDEAPFSIAVTDNALVILVAPHLMYAEDGTEKFLAKFREVLGGDRGTSADHFGEVSSFVSFDLGQLARLEEQMVRELSESLDRAATPQLSPSLTGHLADMQIRIWDVQTPTSYRSTLKLTGMPDLRAMLDGEGGLFSAMTGSSPQFQYDYASHNLQLLHTAMVTHLSDETPDLDALVEGGHIRAGVLQTPFDSRWQGDSSKLRWMTISEVQRDEEGNLNPWINAAAAAMIEANEAQGFRSFRMAEGNVREWLSEMREGFIVAYQAAPETVGGHMVLYANGQVGWLHAKVLQDALALNAEGEAVPTSRGAMPALPPGWDDWDDWDD